MKSGANFTAYAVEKNSTNTAIFLLLLGRRLAKFGVDLSKTTIQTDNGTEFAAAWNTVKKSAFTKACEMILGCRHKTIPPNSPTWNSDVETSHNIIENEFYAVEYFNSRKDFFEKAAKYQRDFNLTRVNKWRGGTPRELAGSEFPQELFEFPPVIVDDFWDLCKDDFAKFSSA